MTMNLDNSVQQMQPEIDRASIGLASDVAGNSRLQEIIVVWAKGKEIS